MKTTTIGITRLFGCMLLASGLWMASCSHEDQQGSSTEPIPGGDDTERREVLLTLNNKLALRAGTKVTEGTSANGSSSAPVTKGIATVAENAISTLDVYVFGSDTEHGEYTFQERFAYRADDNDELPAGASRLQLAVEGGADEDKSAGLLKLKRGLFVKFYCIANDTQLVDPAADGGAPVEATSFVPLTMSDPAEGSVKVLKAGIPMESSFTSYHTHLLTAAAKGDTLACPLAMSGAQTTALDLTNFESSARMQIGIKLTRLAARFDVRNVAEESRFTLQSISMGSGRRGSGYFPIRVYGDVPAAKGGDLITYPIRTFGGENANDGLTTGAFYSYPSPEADQGYLILKGIYKVNATENKEVSYQIPFRQQSANGQEIQLAINHNHRYTLAITEADDYHLDANITVADWADDGNIEYNPDNKPSNLTVTIPEDFKDRSRYAPTEKTVYMSLDEGSTFNFSLTANSDLKVTKVYTGGPAEQQHDWLKIDEQTPVRGAALSTYTYKASLTTPYSSGRYPHATIRLMNMIDGSETFLYVVPLLLAPTVEYVKGSSMPSQNYFDERLATAYISKSAGSRLDLLAKAAGGTKVIEAKDVEIEPLEGGNSSNPEGTYRVMLKDGATSGSFALTNHSYASLKKVINVRIGGYEAPVVQEVHEEYPNLNNLEVKGTAATLYKIAGSRIRFTMETIGGTKVLSYKGGVKVTSKGGNPEEDDGFYNSYEITWNDDANAKDFEVVFANFTDPTMTTTINGTLLSGEIVVVDNMNVMASNGNEQSIPISSPNGCRASIKGWEEGGSKWFEITKQPEAGDSEMIITKGEDNDRHSMTTVTVLLTPKGGANWVKEKTFTVTPIDFQPPTFTLTNKTIEYVKNMTMYDFGYTIPVGSYDEPKSSNLAVATVKINSVTQKIEVTPVGPGTAEITMANGSDPNQIVTHTLTVNKNYMYEDSPAWLYGGEYIAQTDANISETFNNGWKTNPQGPCPNGWHIPSKSEWNNVLRGTSYAYDELVNKNHVFATPEQGQFIGYWSSTEYAEADNNAYYLRVSNSSNTIVVDQYQHKVNPLRVRCIADKKGK